MVLRARSLVGGHYAPKRVGQCASWQPDRHFLRAASRVAPRVWRGVPLAWEAVSARARAFDSSLPNNLRRRLFIPHPNKGAVPKLVAVRPFDERDLTDQHRLYRPTLLDLFGNQRLVPARGLFFREIHEGAIVDDQLLD